MISLTSPALFQILHSMLHDKLNTSYSLKNEMDIKSPLDISSTEL